MGTGTSQNVTTWDDGTYSGSNNGGSSANAGKGPDDLYVITNYNGLSYRSDSEGSDLLTAVPLTIVNGGFGQFGTITTRNDQDYFSFSLASAGTLSLSADPYWSRAFIDGDGVWGGSTTEQLGPIIDLDSSTPWPDHGANLDLSVQVLDASGQVVASSNPSGLRAGFDALALQAGTYTLRMDGVGAGDPTAAIPTGYSDYGSIGNYWLSGTISTPLQPTPAPNPAAVPTLTASDASVLEGSSGGTTLYRLNINLSAAAEQDVLLSYASRDGSATAKGKTPDYTAISNGQLVIPKGQLGGSIPLSIVADQRSESDEAFFLDFTAISGAVLGRSSVAVTILNDDLINGGSRKSSSVALAYGSSDSGMEASTGAPQGRDPLTGSGTGSGTPMPGPALHPHLSGLETGPSIWQRQSHRWGLPAAERWSGPWTAHRWLSGDWTPPHLHHTIGGSGMTGHMALSWGL
ncbi:MAG: Calx-beta domain-containing protein [Cyanobium sp.]